MPPSSSAPAPAPKTLSDKTKAIVKSTAPVLAAHGTTITATFYPILFRDFPQVRELFNRRNQANDPAHGEDPKHVGAQPRALANAVYAYAANIDNLGALADAVKLIAHKHTALHVLPEHYPMVGQSLLRAIKEVLGDAATDDIMNAWAEAYGFLADILIGAENGLRHENEAKPHGWSGFKDMTVLKKVQESEDVASFYIGNTDGSAVPSWVPGQYITVRAPAPDGLMQERNYSLSTAPNGKHFRVSIKRLTGGVVSNYFHDNVKEGSTVSVGPPYGEFLLEPQPAEVNKPLVLVSAGVGITPVLAMLEWALANTTRKVYFIHGAHDGAHAPFLPRLRELAAANPGRLGVQVAFSQPRAGADTAGKDYDSAGRVCVGVLRAALKDVRPADCDFKFCGPTGFMVDLRGLLSWLGVPASSVHFECFGPLVSDIEAAVAPSA